MAAITFENVRKSFGAVEVLKDVSLKIADGEFLTLLGPSGCGKSDEVPKKMAADTSALLPK